IAPLEVKSEKSEVRRQRTDVGDQSEEKLIIESGIEKIKVAEEIPSYGQQTSNTGHRTPDIGQPSTGKISALDKIRKQYKSNGASANGNNNHPLKEDELIKAWAEYVQKLKEAKNPAAQSFEMAELRIKDENSFEAVTASNIEQKFIEQDRNKLFSFLQEKLNNRLLQFAVIIEDKPGNRPKIEVPLSSKDQLQKMMEQYPLVKELKDKLKLDLDY
ncbi:MAG TPA: hypothetical protein VI461_04590, partial [Chitinophagaceae bacterium]|nr:hypothetical protein [Chitinophagaceae bacterium]